MTSSSSMTTRAKIRCAARFGAALILAASLAGSMQAQSTGKKIPGAAKPAPGVMIDKLAQIADVVAAGRVSDLRSEWNADKSRIQTRVTVAVEQDIKGDAVGESITLLVPGGEVDGVGELYTHTVQFRENEDVLVFASKDAKGDLRVTSGVDGKYMVEKDRATGRKVIPSVGTLEEISARIKAGAKAPSTQSKSN